VSAAAWTDPETGKLFHWQEQGQAQQIAEMRPVCINAIPARWSHPASSMDGAYLQITDSRTGAVIGDLRFAQNSALLAEPYLAENRLHVRFGLGRDEHILIVDPGEERCRLAGGKWQALSVMQSLIDGALKDMRAVKTEPEYRVHSPDGRIRIDYFESEHRNNEWLPSPEIRDLETGATILKYTHYISNAHHDWLGAGRFALFVTNTFMPPLTVYFDVDARTVRLQDDGPDRPIAEASALVESWLKKEDAKVDMWPAQGGRSVHEYNWKYAMICGAIAGLLMLGLLYFGGLI
jgi:hypothetical protein